MNLEPAELIRLSTLLDEVLDLDAAGREAWLAGLQGDDALLLPTLRHILVAQPTRDTADLLERGPSFTALAEAPAEAQFSAGEHVGPYRLERAIGQGGMGEVWLAVREDGQLKRQVALKLPTLSARRAVLVQRFARERDILGSLAHPHIARLYDAGLAGVGQPYLALEYVEGRPITAYCEEAALATRARVQLLQQVLQAVQYAHANLVIHRDLKPSNVLVTAQGQAMLLDFGIAKLLQEDAPEAAETELTRLGGRAMTLHYAAPEQISGAPISIATDVWALGVLLYEVLTGKRPFSGKPRELENAILHEEPARPQGLPADLATIVLKALKKAPAERYATADAFSEDLGRWLANEPVLAQADSAWYRLRKFATRYKIAVATGTVAITIVIAAMASTVWQAHTATVQARRAQAVQALVVRLFSESDPAQAQGRAFTAKELIDRRVTTLDAELRDQPELKAAMEKEIGRVYANLHDDATALLHLRKAVQGYDDLGAESTEAAIEARLLLAQSLTLEALLADASVHALRTQSLAERQLGPEHPLALRARLALGRIDVRSGRSREAADRYRGVIEEMDRAQLPPSLLRLSALRALAKSQYDLELLTDMLQTSQRIRREASAIVDVKPGTLLGIELDELKLRVDLGQYDVVLQRMPALVTGLEDYYGDASDAVHEGRDYWSVALAAAGQYDEAVTRQERNLASAAKRRTADAEELAFHHSVMAEVLYGAGRYPEALTAIRDSLGLLRNSPNSVAELCKARALEGFLAQATGEPDGESETRNAVAQYLALPGHASYASSADMLELLAVVEHGAGHRAAARDSAVRAMSIRRARGQDSAAVDVARSEALASWMLALASPSSDQALSAWRAAASRYAAMQPPGHLAHGDLALMDTSLVQASTTTHPTSSVTSDPFVTLH